MSKNNNNSELNSESDMIFYGGEFAGRIAVNSLIKENLLHSYNLVGGDRDKLTNGDMTFKVSNLFNGFAIPSALLHMPKIYGGENDDIESEEEDVNDDYEMSERNEKKHASYEGGKKDTKTRGENKKGRSKIMTHNDPDAGVVSESLYDKFLQMAQDLDMYKNSKKTKKRKIIKTNKQNKLTKKRK